jgi:hypothetical protein
MSSTASSNESDYQVMSVKTYYQCEFRIDGRRLYVVWYTNDEDGVVRQSDGKIASFANEHQLHAFCEANAMSLKDPAIYDECDFDEIAAWCSRPAAEAIDPVAFLVAWNMLDDALRVQFDARSQYWTKSQTPLANKMYEKLFWGNNLPAVTPPGKHYEPIWSQEEVETLSRVFFLGLAELRASIQGID